MYFFYKVVELVGGGSVYKRGLPRPVFVSHAISFIHILLPAVLFPAGNIMWGVDLHSAETLPTINTWNCCLQCVGVFLPIYKIINYDVTEMFPTKYTGLIYQDFFVHSRLYLFLLFLFWVVFCLGPNRGKICKVCTQGTKIYHMKLTLWLSQKSGGQDI